MNTIIENDIMHIGRVMRASLLQGLTDNVACDYWDNRLTVLYGLPHLTNNQRHWVAELMRELDEIRGASHVVAGTWLMPT